MLKTWRKKIVTILCVALTVGMLPMNAYATKGDKITQEELSVSENQIELVDSSIQEEDLGHEKTIVLGEDDSVTLSADITEDGQLEYFSYIPPYTDIYSLTGHNDNWEYVRAIVYDDEYNVLWETEEGYEGAAWGHILEAGKKYTIGIGTYHGTATVSWLFQCDHDFSIVDHITVNPTCEEVGEGIYQCSNCDRTTLKKISENGHQWDDGIVISEGGLYVKTVKKTCTVCGEIETFKEVPDIDKIPEVVLDNEGKATFTTDFTENDKNIFFKFTPTLTDNYRIYSEMGKNYADGRFYEYDPDNGITDRWEYTHDEQHDYYDGSLHLDEGRTYIFETVVCEVCNKNFEGVVKVCLDLRHYISEPTQIIERTCTTGRVEIGECVYCGETVSIAYKALGHIFYQGVCLVCGQLKDDYQVLFSGNCGENATWLLDNKGTLIISGTGAIQDYATSSVSRRRIDEEYAPWLSEDIYDKIKTVKIEEGITRIGKGAFDCYYLPTECQDITFYLPDSLESIGSYAFRDTGKGNLQIPLNVVSLDDYAFAYSTFENIQLNEQISEIPKSAFQHSTIEELVIGEHISIINASAFARCSNLRKVTIRGSEVVINNNAFSDCTGLLKIIFEGNAPEIKDNSFYRVNATAYYPEYDQSWTNEKRANYGGSLTWIAYENSTDICNHIWGEGYVTKNPTAESEGEIRYTCEECGATKVESIPKLENPFKDVSGTAYFYDAVIWAVGNDITGGTSDTTFSPKQSCTRAQVMTFLWKANGSPEPKSTRNPFTDIKSSNYYYKAVLWAVENGITEGATATTFAPSKECTREQVVSFMWKAAGEPEPEAGANPFTDVSNKKYYYKPVMWAVQNGIASGATSTTFGTGKICNRAQVMTFLYNAYH